MKENKKDFMKDARKIPLYYVKTVRGEEVTSDVGFAVMLAFAVGKIEGVPSKCRRI